MDYYTQKAKKIYELFLKGEDCRKVYAAVRKGDKYVVIKNAEGKKWKYQIAGGGVEAGETNEDAIVREVSEELNMNAKIVKSLGFIKYLSNWKYDEKEFSVNNVSEVFLLEFVSDLKNAQLGLDGEFTDDVKGIVLISEEEMLANVYEFASGGVQI